MLVNEATTRLISLAVATVAAEVRPLAGCGERNKELIDAIACANLLKYFDRDCADLALTMRLCEGLKDGAPHIPEGSRLGRGHQQADAICDPVEGTGSLAEYNPAQRSRGSMAVFAIAPLGSVAQFFSGIRALKLVLPPGIAEGQISLDSPPSDIVFAVCQACDCRPADVDVTILRREANVQAIEAFRRTGASVIEIPSGDFEAHIRAALPVDFGRRPQISYGIGGLPEGVLAVPCVLMTGATLLLRPDPLGNHTEEILKAGCGGSIGRDYCARELIATEDYDCMVAVAGITDSSILAGTRTGANVGQTIVEVLVAAPRFRKARWFSVSLTTDFDFAEQPAA